MKTYTNRLIGMFIAGLLFSSASMHADNIFSRLYARIFGPAKQEQAIPAPAAQTITTNPKKTTIPIVQAIPVKSVVVKPVAKKPIVPKQKPIVAKKPVTPAPKRTVVQRKPVVHTAVQKKSPPKVIRISPNNVSALAKKKALATVLDKKAALPVKKVVLPISKKTIQPLSNTIIYVPVKAQKGAECGYHALFNSWKKYQELLGRPTPRFPLKTWRDLIIQARGDDDEGAWIDYQEMVTLADQSRINPETYSIIHDIGQFKFTQRQLEFYENLLNLPDIIEKLRTRNGYAHAFIIGDMKHSKASSRSAGPSLQASLGHWIAIVAQRANNKIVYYVMDSLGGKPTRNVTLLKDLIEKSNLNQMHEVVTTIRLLNTVKNNLNVARHFLYRAPLNIPRALATLQETLELLLVHGKQETVLKQYIERITKDLKHIQSQYPDFAQEATDILDILPNH